MKPISRLAGISPYSAENFRNMLYANGSMLRIIYSRFYSTNW